MNKKQMFSCCQKVCLDASNKHHKWKKKQTTKNKKTKAKNKSHLTEEKVIYTVYNWFGQPKLDFAALINYVWWHCTIVVFRVPFGISQSPKHSLNMMEIQHFTTWTLSWKLSQQPSSCNKKVPMEFLPRKHPPLETSSYGSYPFTRILHWYKKSLFCLNL